MRFFADIPLALDTKVQLPDDVAHHLVKVLRANIGSTLFIFNGQGGMFEAELTEAGKNQPPSNYFSFMPMIMNPPCIPTLAK